MTTGAAAGGTGRATPSDDLVELLKAAAARELQEHGGQMLVLTSSHPPHLVDRALGDDAPLVDDADAVAHLLGHLQRVRAHQDRDAVTAHAAEDVLDQPGP